MARRSAPLMRGDTPWPGTRPLPLVASPARAIERGKGHAGNLASLKPRRSDSRAASPTVSITPRCALECGKTQHAGPRGDARQSRARQPPRADTRKNMCRARGKEHPPSAGARAEGCPPHPPAEHVCLRGRPLAAENHRVERPALRQPCLAHRGQPRGEGRKRESAQSLTRRALSPAIARAGPQRRLTAAGLPRWPTLRPARTRYLSGHPGCYGHSSPSPNDTPRYASAKPLPRPNLGEIDQRPFREVTRTSPG